MYRADSNPTMSERLSEYARSHAIAAAEDGRPCPCGGRGWISTPFDTWEPCFIHRTADSVHPQDYSEVYDEKEVGA